MEIYIQEVSSVLFLPRLPDQTRQKVLHAAGSFGAMLAQAVALASYQFPEQTWFAVTAVGMALSPG